ncbi:MAG: pilus assembly protein PilM, partial [Armatimonadetes bacterium]|nr:pilus assembly protein PilM [Armatimonadota bacterium]
VERRGRTRAIRFAEQPLPAGYRWEVGADRRPLVEAVRRALAKAGIRTRKAVIALQRRQVTARISAFPPADRANLEQVVGYDLADHIPFPVDQVVVGIQPLGPSREEPGLTDVLVVAAQRELVGEYLGVAEALGLRPVALTLDALALDDLTRLVPREPVGVTVMVALGERATTINASEQGRLKLTRSIGIGGQQLTRAIQEDLELTADEAERQKWAQGLRLLGGESRPRRIAAWLDNLLGEVRRSALSFGPAAVSAVLLAGDEADIPGLSEAIRAEFGVEPMRLSTAALFPQAQLRGESPEVADRCLLAVGQALRAAGRSAWTISLLPREVVAARRARRLGVATTVAGVLVVAGMVMAYTEAARGLARRSETVRDLGKQTKTALAQRTYAEEVRAERERLQEQVDELKMVRLTRYTALELLNTIAFYSPKDIVLNDFTLGTDHSLEIQGSAPSTAVVADLQNALSASPLVTDIRIMGVAAGGSRGPTGPRRAQTQRQDDGSVVFTMQLRLWAQEKAASTAAALADRGGKT